MRELLIKSPPKLILDNYWELLSYIAFKGFSFLKEDSFTIAELREELLGKARELHGFNPFLARLYARSLTIAEDLVNELICLGLLVKEGEAFRRTKDLIEFYFLMKNRVKTSSKRLVAWIILHLYYSRSLREFSTPELVNLLSYSDEECEKELPHLVKYEDDSWLPVLEKNIGKWRILRKPYGTTKPILLVGLSDRLQIAILELSKQSDEVTTYQIIEKLRQLECKSLERALTMLGLRKKDGTWYVNEDTSKRVEHVLLKHIEVEMKWPLFGIISTTNPYFKIEGELHNAYIDVPNELINRFLDRLYALPVTHHIDLETLYTEASKLKDEFNENFKQNFGSWLCLKIRREFFGERPFGVQMKIDWGLFQKFLEVFAEREDLSLEEKYEYLSMCRSGIAWMRGKPSEELMEERVKSLSSSLIGEINSIITSFIEKLREKRERYRKKLLLEKGRLALTLSYLPELISTLRIISYCISRGVISTCYREMRKILESISWVAVDDILLFRRDELRGSYFIPPLRIPSKEWYEWARSERLIVKSVSEFVKPLIKKLMEKYNVSRNEVEKSLFNNITYPLFIILAKTEKEPPIQLRDVFLYDTEVIKPFIKKNIEEIVSQLISRPLGDSDEKFITDLLNLTTVRKYASLCYPSNSFIIQLLGKISKLNILDLYERYSYFVHSYDKTWHFYPFSSVLEFMIFKHELKQFIRLITRILDFYEKEIIYSIKHKT